jgi:ubiquinone/menaquinone biosynthesis C-methylase UbiE
LCSAIDPAAQDRLRDLDARLNAFYNSPFAHQYFRAAESYNETWTASMPAHAHLKAAVPIGSRVVDLGCGSTHTARNLADRQVHYTGVDWAIEQIERNHTDAPGAQFVASSLYQTPFADGSFDVAISLFVVEHLVWPHRLLDEMRRLVRPGGLIAVLTPPFRRGHYLKSFDYGLTPRPIRDKLRTGALLDALLHLYHHRVYMPWHLRRRYPRDTARFLIHLNPVVLHAPRWFPDADAVYLSDTAELAAHLSGDADIVTHWPWKGYVLLRRRAADPRQ